MKHIYISSIAILLFAPQIIFAAELLLPTTDTARINFLQTLINQLDHLKPDPYSKNESEVKTMRNEVKQAIRLIEMDKTHSFSIKYGQTFESASAEITSRANKAREFTDKLLKLRAEKTAVSISKETLKLTATNSKQVEIATRAAPKQGIFARMGNLFKPKVPLEITKSNAGGTGVNAVTFFGPIVAGDIIKMRMGSQEQMIDDLEQKIAAKEARIKRFAHIEDTIGISDNANKLKELKALEVDKKRLENLREAVHQKNFRTY